MNYQVFIRAFTTLALMLYAGIATADWQLNNDQSSLQFASVKNTQFAEVHSFKTLSGGLTKDGNVAINIDLASVDTLIPIRDQRMKEMLFNVVSFPQARVSASVDYGQVDALKAGQAIRSKLPLTIDLHGQQKTLETKVSITRLSGNQLAVAGLQPILLNTDDFALAEGVEKLRAVVGLANISPIVPVTVNLIFEKR